MFKEAKLYLFDNAHLNNKKGFVTAEVFAKNILEAKQKVKDMGYEGLRFAQIRILFGERKKRYHERKGL